MIPRRTAKVHWTRRRKAQAFFEAAKAIDGGQLEIKGVPRETVRRRLRGKAADLLGCHPDQLEATFEEQRWV